MRCPDLHRNVIFSNHPSPHGWWCVGAQVTKNNFLLGFAWMSISAQKVMFDNLPHGKWYGNRGPSVKNIILLYIEWNIQDLHKKVIFSDPHFPQRLRWGRSRVKLQEIFLLGMEWNVHICTEKPSFPHLTPMGIFGVCIKLQKCLGIEWIFQICTEKVCLWISILWGVEVNLQRNFLLEIVWNVQICTEKSCLTNLYTMKWEVKLQKSRFFAWTVQICKEKSSFPTLLPYGGKKGWLFYANLSIPCNSLVASQSPLCTRTSWSLSKAFKGGTGFAKTPISFRQKDWNVHVCVCMCT